MAKRSGTLDRVRAAAVPGPRLLALPARQSDPYGLGFTRENRVAVGLVVAALFMERFERIDDGSYPFLPIPDLIFLSAVGILAAKSATDLLRGRLALRPLGRKELALVAFVALLAGLSFSAVVIEPETVTNGVQALKTTSHLVVLLGVAIFLGRVLSSALVRWALQVYFAGAVAVSLLGIVQSVDQNLVGFGLSSTLDLVSRPAVDFVRPCSIFSEPAYLGYAALGGILIGLSIVSEANKRLAAGGSAICVAALLLASAAGPLAVAAPLALYVLVMRRRLFPSGLVPTVAALAGVAALLWFLTPVGGTVIYRAEAVSTGTDPSADLRTKLNEGSIEVWKIAPVTGVGLGNSRQHLTDFVTLPFLPGGQYSFNSANAYVNLLGEAGPVGVAALLVVLFALWWRNHGAAMRLEELTRAFIVLLALAFLVINPLIMPPLWFWAGLRLSLQQQQG